jgi:hypothetical protein
LSKCGNLVGVATPTESISVELDPNDIPNYTQTIANYLENDWKLLIAVVLINGKVLVTFTRPGVK